MSGQSVRSTAHVLRHKSAESLTCLLGILSCESSSEFPQGCCGPWLGSLPCCLCWGIQLCWPPCGVYAAWPSCSQQAWLQCRMAGDQSLSLQHACSQGNFSSVLAALCRHALTHLSEQLAAGNVLPAQPHPRPHTSTFADPARVLQQCWYAGVKQDSMIHAVCQATHSLWDSSGVWQACMSG